MWVEEKEHERILRKTHQRGRKIFRTEVSGKLNEECFREGKVNLMVDVGQQSKITSALKLVLIPKLKSKAVKLTCWVSTSATNKTFAKIGWVGRDGTARLTRERLVLNCA